ncbi:hypothetical protein Adt_40724 [Abeliophyllum distichum]|uniref:Uncharacterized protein n=1 Tax=Abeliophyllum distichum TaxID=126358 RepID=A0ABD1PND8_9LAMI
MILKYGYGFREQFGPIPNGYRIFRFPDLLWKLGLVDSDAIDGGGTTATASTGPISKRKGFGGLEEVLQMILKYGDGFREQFGPIPNGYRNFRFPDLLRKPGLVDSDAIDGGGTAATASTIKHKKIWSKDECTSVFLNEEMRKLKRKL